MPLDTKRLFVWSFAFARIQLLTGHRSVDLSDEPAEQDARIPNIVFFSGPRNPEEVVKVNRAFVPPGTEFRFYNYPQLDASAKKISARLEEVGVHGAYEALHKFRPHAYRCDLWRYMQLWDTGGIYLDAKLALTAPISNWVDQWKDRFALCKVAYSGTSGAHPEWKGHYQSSVLAARAREPALLAVMQHVIKNANDHYYGEPSNFHADLDISGPGALTHAFKNIGFSPVLTVSCIRRTSS